MQPRPTPAAGPDARPARQSYRLREDFPILRRTVHGKPLVYLDNAASTQKPEAVVEAVRRFYLSECSNVHRGLHELSVRATAAFEETRDRVQHFIGARDRTEIVFTRGTTESINLVARSWGDAHVRSGDEILVTEMEHHSNIVPWQQLCERTGARLCVVPVDDRGELRIDELERLLGKRTRMVAITHVSNALGTCNPVARVVELAHAHGSLVLIDGAQAVAHRRVDVQALGCDFYAFSGHKMYGPTGTGVLYGRRDLLERMPPFQGGGDMIRTVTFARTTYADPPQRFEAGTPNIAGVIGLGAAVEYLSAVGFDELAAEESELLACAAQMLDGYARIRRIGTADERVGVISFTLEGIHPHDVGTVLDHEGVAVRAGHHCAQPLMQRFGVPATVRASFGCYNVIEDVDALARGIDRVLEVLG